MKPKVGDFASSAGWPCKRWGEPRETVDIDLTLLTGFGGEDIEKVLAKYVSRIDDAADFARARRVLLVRASSGVGIDIALGALPFEESAVSRSSLFDFPGARLRTCSAEDLIVMKAFAARARDWVDVEGILVRQMGRLDLHRLPSSSTSRTERPGNLDGTGETPSRVRAVGLAAQLDMR